MSKIKTTSEIIKEFQKIHKDTYNYSKVNYINSSIKVEIICTKHQSFWQLPSAHKQGHGCPGCNSSNKKTTFETIKDFKKVHKDKYNYSKVNYNKSVNKVEIICPEHGSFFMSPNAHLSLKYGCPKCSSSKGEFIIQDYLEENKIDYIKEAKLIPKELYRWDFFIEEYNLAIEFDGVQHFEAVPYFGGEEAFQKTQERDKIKDKYCIDNNINSLRIPYWNINNIEEIVIEEIDYLEKEKICH